MAGDWPNQDSVITAINAKTTNLPATPGSQADAQSGATVPTADVTTNVNERDVVGNKTDAAVTTVGTTKTLMAYLKGILNRTPTSGTIAVVTDVQSGATVATTDGTSTANSRDVVGAKDDAAVTVIGTTKSLVAMIKGILNRLPTSGTVAVATDVTAGPTVPSADSTANTNDRDVTGNKTDAAVTTVGTTKSVIAYLKGILNRLPTSGTVAVATDVTSGATVPSEDSTNNALASEVIGNKTDAAVTTVGTTKSIIAYLKGILNRMPTSGTVMKTTDSVTVGTNNDKTGYSLSTAPAAVTIQESLNQTVTGSGGTWSLRPASGKIWEVSVAMYMTGGSNGNFGPIAYDGTSSFGPESLYTLTGGGGSFHTHARIISNGLYFSATNNNTASAKVSYTAIQLN